MVFRQRILWLVLLAMLSIAMAAFLQGRHEHHVLGYAQQAERVQSTIQQELDEINHQLDLVEPLIKSSWLNERSLASGLNADLIPPRSSFYLYKGKELKYWSDNKTATAATDLTSFESGSVHFIGNGWYIIQKRVFDDRQLIGLLLIQHQYLLQNQYLQNSFNQELGLTDDVKLLIKPIAGTWAITDSRNRYLFSLSFGAGNETTTSPCSVPAFYGLAVFLFLLFALDVLIHTAKSRSVLGILFLLAIIALRYVMLEFRIPAPLYETDLFSPKYYASSFLLNSLGDLLVSVSVFGLIIVYLYTFFGTIKLRSERNVNKGIRAGIVIIIFLATFLFSVLINYLLSGLIINSQISFNISNVFELTGFSMIGMLVFGILLVSLYLMCDGCVQYIRKTGFGFTYVSILFLVSQGIFLALLLSLRETDLFSDYGVSAFLLANILIIFITYIRSSERRLFSFSRTVLVIFGFSVYAAQMIYTFNLTREQEKRQLIAAKLENEQDLVAEYLFQDIETKIKTDASLISFFQLPVQSIMSNPMIMDDLNRRLIRQYFSGYLGRYEVNIKYFTANEIPINRIGDPTWNIDALKTSMLQNGKPTLSTNFYFLPDQSGRSAYSGIIDVVNNNTKSGTIILQLNARYIQDENGFPDLLLSNKIDPQHHLANYSYARYRDGKLVGQSGAYNYFLTSAPYEEYFRHLTGMRFVSFDQYSHLFYRFNNSGLIIVSAPALGLTVFITLFSYIFTVFSLAFLMLYLVVRWVQLDFNLQINFKSRIQLTVVAIVVATLVLLGVATVAYIVNNYEHAQNNRIREKLNNVLVLVESELGTRNDLGQKISDDLLYSLAQLSNTLSVDFNIYGLNGAMLFSSQPKIYDQELMAPLMNREAYTKLTSNQKSLFIQNEKIGKLSYIAAYEPIRNSENNTIGYLNLPYFAKETELKKDISEFLVALINIYILLFSVAVLLAFFISNRITEPLRIIQDSLKRTKLGTTSEPIIWKQKDEIGALINEYNRMLNQLQKSAELLARSERESAWREMAKQVAHEIKNPLTPMKLGIQHLQRALQDEHPNKEEMVQRICNTLIEQIDTLSNIANEFSNFAKMPKPEYTRVDLSAVLEHTVDLYSETERMKIILSKPEGILEVQGDKDQLLRIFSNLLKNAVQAIPEDRDGLINVDVTSNENYFTIAVKDNGHGIPKSRLDKIFVPNFTTKTGGTGLGLAMVKNMLESMDGAVSFESSEGNGTTFFVKLQRG